MSVEVEKHDIHFLLEYEYTKSWDLAWVRQESMTEPYIVSQSCEFIHSKVAQGKIKMIEKVKFGVHNEMREKIIKKNTHKFVRLV